MSTKKNCTQCNEKFDISPQEREEYVKNGFIYEPKKCLNCRLIQRAQKEGKPLYPFTCSKCKNLRYIDFRPNPGKPLLCMICFKEKKLKKIEDPLNNNSTSNS